MIIQLPPMTLIWGETSQEYNGLTVEVVDYQSGWAWINPDDWAPGVWAGTEGATIHLDGYPHKVLMVDLSGAKVKLEVINV